MKNTTAAITGALVTAVIGGLAYVGKQIYDAHHYYGAMIDDDEYETDSYQDEDLDEDGEAEKVDAGVDEPDDDGDKEEVELSPEESDEEEEKEEETTEDDQ